MTTLPVRCCCNPALLLGYVPVPASHARAGCRIHFALNPPKPTFFEEDEGPTTSFFRNTLALTVGEAWGTWDGHLHGPQVALKSDDTPLDVLRRIPGFEEVNRLVPVAGKEAGPTSAD